MKIVNGNERIFAINNSIILNSVFATYYVAKSRYKQIVVVFLSDASKLLGINQTIAPSIK